MGAKDVPTAGQFKIWPPETKLFNNLKTINKVYHDDLSFADKFKYVVSDKEKLKLKIMKNCSAMFLIFVFALSQKIEAKTIKIDFSFNSSGIGGKGSMPSTPIKADNNLMAPPSCTNVAITGSSKTNLTCNGINNGSATVTVSGGPFNGSGGFLWSPSGGTGLTATGLAAGNYTFTATNSCGNSSFTVITITQPSSITLNASASTILCNGNSSNLTASASGGTGAFTYTWMPGTLIGASQTVTPSVNTVYTVTAKDANNCTSTKTLTVVVPTLLTITAGASSTICSGSNAFLTASATGGTGTLSYNWMTGNLAGASQTVSPGSNKTYTVTVTDANACTSIATQAVTVINPITTASISSNNVTCNGSSNGSATVTASGGTSFTYSWSPTGGTSSIASGLGANTYSCVVKNNCNNAATVTVSITQPSAISLTAGASSTICLGTNASLSASASGGAGSFTYNWMPGSLAGANQTVTPSVNTTYTVTATDANACASSTTQAVTVINPTVTASISSQNNVTCNGLSNGSATITASGGSGITYSWSPSGGSASIASGLSAGSYTCVIKNSCNNAATVTVSITQPSAISLTAGASSTICLGSNASLSANASGGTGSFTYTWNPGNLVGANQTVSPSGNQTYTVTAKDANACTSTTTQIVTVINPIVTASISAKNNVTCNGLSNGSATITASGGSGFTYSWSPSGGNSSSASGLSAGSYTCVVKNSCNNAATVTVSITQPSAISLTAGASSTICLGSNASLSANASGGTGSFTYNWVPGSLAGANQTVSPSVNTTYTVTATDANACASSATQMVTVINPTVTASISSQNNVTCNGLSNGSATITASGGSGITYSWSPSGSTSSIVSGLSAGSYTCVVTNNCGNSSNVATIITQPSAISLTAGASSTICLGSNASLSASASGGTGSFTYNWMPGSLAGANQTVSPSVNTIYTVTATDANACASSTTQAVTVINPTVTASISSQNNVTCNGLSNGSATITASGGSGITYSWSPSGSTSPIVSGLSAGSYTCVVTNNCGNSSNVATIITQPSAIFVTAGASSTICLGSNASLSASASGGAGSFTYNWMPGNLAGASQTVSPSVNTTYTVTATDANACASSATQIVSVINPIVTASISSQNNVTCNGLSNGSATITASGGSGITYSWSPSGSTSPIVSGLSAGSYTCVVTNNCGNSSNVATIITQPSAISLTAGASSTICLGSNASLSASAGGGTGSFTYNWMPGNLVGANQSVSPSVNTTYTVTATDANACASSTTQIVSVTNPTITASISSQNNVTCNGLNNGSATISASGGSGITYSWSPSGGTSSIASGLSAGSYTCVVKNSCANSVSVSVTITEPLSPLSLSISSNSTICIGASTSSSISATGGTGAITFNWMPGNLSGSSQIITPSSTTVYTVMATDANSCNAIANQTITIVNCSGPQFVSGSCGATLTTLDQTLTFSSVSGATNYRLEIINAQEPFSTNNVRWNNLTTFKMSWVPGIQYGRTYSVRIAAYVGGVWQSYGNTCTITTPAIASIPTTQFSVGNVTLNSLDQQLNFPLVLGATNYKLQITNASQPFSVVNIRFNTVSYFKMAWVSGIQYSRTYDVKISAYINDTWQPYGNVSQITTPSLIPFTQLETEFCGITLSSLSQIFNFEQVLGAENYKVEVVNGSQPLNVINVRNNHLTTFALSYITGTQLGRTYDIRVAANVGGVWGEFGPMCQITAASAKSDIDDVTLSNKKRLNESIVNQNPEIFINLFPNPTNGEVNIESSESVKTILVYNISGELIATEENINRINLSNFLNGFYIIHVKTETNSKVFRIIKQ